MSIEEGIIWKGDERIPEICVNNIQEFTLDGLVDLISSPVNLACREKFKVMEYFYRTSKCYNVTSNAVCLAVGALMNHPKFDTTLLDALIRVYDKDPYGFKAYKIVQFFGFMLSNLPLTQHITSINNNQWHLTIEFKDLLEHLMPHHKSIVIEAFEDRVIHCKATNESLQQLSCPPVKHKVNLLPIRRTSFKIEPSSIWDIPPKELAIEHTLCSHEMLKAINIGDFLYVDKFPAVEGGIKDICTLSNEISDFVLYAVVSENKSPQKRAEKLSYLIRFADELIKLGNTNDAMAVISPIREIQQRLHTTWSLISESDPIIKKYNEANELLSRGSGFLRLRYFMRNQSAERKPQVEYMGIFHTNLQFAIQATSATITRNEKTFFTAYRWLIRFNDVISFYNSLQPQYPYVSIPCVRRITKGLKSPLSYDELSLKLTNLE